MVSDPTVLAIINAIANCLTAGAVLIASRTLTGLLRSMREEISEARRNRP